MGDLKRLIPSPATVIACVALVFALGGTGLAAGSVSPQASGGSDVKAALAKAGSESQRGPRGPRGPRGFRGPRGLRGPAGPAGAAGAAGAAGPAGPAGPAATSLWASVDTTGTLVRNKGVASAQKNATGDYQVIFSQDVTTCAYQATLGGPTTGVFAGEITVGQRVAIPAGLRVFTLNSAGTPTDAAFFVSVFC